MSESTPGGSKTGASGDDVYSNDTSSDNASTNEKSKENSPEKAGVVRGLARSAARKGASHVAVGRLPLGSHTKGIHASIASAKTSRIRNLAKVSERAEKGYYVFESHQHAASEEAKKEKNSKNTNGSTSTTKKGSSWISRAPAFAGSLAKHTILGMTVFNAYDGVIGRFLVHSEERKPGKSQPESSDRSEARFNERQQLHLWKHYAAGFCAGGVHASLESLMDGLSASRTTARPSVTATSPLKWFQTTARAFYPDFLKHTASHAVLFGSYVTAKRTATIALANATTGLGTKTNNTEFEHQDDESKFFDEDLIPVVFAGGFAGIAQQFAADMTKQLTNALTQKASTSNESFLSAIKPPRYSPRSLLMVSSKLLVCSPTKIEI